MSSRLLLSMLAAMSTVGTSGAACAADVGFAETRIEVAVDSFHYEFVRMNDDARIDLLLSVRDGLRSSLTLYLQRKDGSFPNSPDWRMTLPPDVVSYCTMDLRRNPGKELLLLTANGAFSVSPHEPGLRGNLRRELTVPLFPNVPPTGPVPRWELVADANGDGNSEVYLASDDQLVTFGLEPGTDGGEQTLVPRGRLKCEQDHLKLRPTVKMSGQEFNFSMRGTGPSIFPGTPSSRPGPPFADLFSRREEWDLPSLVDWNRDGATDAIFLRPRSLKVSTWNTDKYGPMRQETLPGALEGLDGEDPDLELRDLDGDGFLEIIATMKGEDGALSKDHVVVVIHGVGPAKFSAKPSARVKIAASNVEFRWHDVNHDGLQDLFARAVKVPVGISQLSSLYIEVGLSVYLGEPGGRLSDDPVLRQERRLRPEQLERIRETFLTDLSGDYQGDGLNDLVRLQPDGLLEITRIEGSGSDLTLAEEPWSRYRPLSLVTGIETWDLSSDGVSDLVLLQDEMLTVFVSRKDP